MRVRIEVFGDKELGFGWVEYGEKRIATASGPRRYPTKSALRAAIQRRARVAARVPAAVDLALIDLGRL